MNQEIFESNFDLFNKKNLNKFYKLTDKFLRVNNQEEWCETGKYHWLYILSNYISFLKLYEDKLFKLIQQMEKE